MHSIRRRSLFVLAGCLSDVLCQASGSVVQRERNAQPNTGDIREVSDSDQSQSIRFRRTHADTGCRVLAEDITSCSTMHSEHTLPCAGENKPLLPSGVIKLKVNRPPSASKSLSRLPPDLLPRVNELVRQNPDMSQDAVGQTGRGKRVCEYEQHRMKRRRSVECQCHSTSIGENESGGPISTSSSDPGSLRSSPFLSQSNDANDVKTDLKHPQGEKVHGNHQEDTARVCVSSLACNADHVSPVSIAKEITAFADTDKSVHTDDLCEKLCTSRSVVQGEKRRKQKNNRNKHGAHNEMSAGIDDEETSKRKLPNYFIAIQVSNPEVHEGLRAVQERIVSSNEQLRAALVPLATLHLTLMVMRLSDTVEELDRARQALDCCGRKLRNETSSRQLDFTVQGLGNFRNSVVFANVAAAGPILDTLNHIAETVITTFADVSGILPMDTKDFKPHMTIMKLSRSPTLRKKVHKIDPALYGSHMETTFGGDSIHNIQLCSMYKPKDKQGYYHVDHTVAVRNYSTTTVPPGGNVTNSGNDRTNCGSKENQNERGEKEAGRGTKSRVDSEVSPGTFTEQLEVMLEWTFKKPDDS